MATAVENYPLKPEDLLIDDVDQALAEQEITAVVARAALIAPCILDELRPSWQAARSILIDVAIRRYWVRKRAIIAGVSTSREMGGRSRADDARALPVSFTPAEIIELQDICRAATGGPAGQATLPQWSFPAAQAWPDSAC